jgi:heme exporter protein C
MKTLLQQIALPPKKIIELANKTACYGLMMFFLITPGLLWHIYQLPFEMTQGIHVRMLFLHVPCALCSMFFYTIMTINACLYLIWHLKLGLNLTKSFLIPTLFLSLATLVTGALWGAPTWGTPWIWDARLTSSLILFLFLFLEILILKLPTQRNKLNKIFCIVVILGWIDLPLIHFSVEWFQTLHQGASLSLLKPITIDRVYLIPLITAILNTSLWTLSISSYHLTKLSK